MSQFRVASRYAKSLIEMAQERGSLEDVYADMQAFASSLNGNRDLTLMFNSPIVHTDSKLKIVEILFGQIFNELTLSMFKIILKKHREPFLKEITQEYFRLYNVIKGIINAKVTTTASLNEDQKNEIANFVLQLTGNKVALQEAINAELIGGFVLQVEDKKIDASVSGALKKIKNDFLRNPYNSN